MAIDRRENDKTLQITLWLIGIMLAVIGWLATTGINNNTKAMERLVATLDGVELRMTKHDVRLENHEVRLQKGGL